MEAVVLAVLYVLVLAAYIKGYRDGVNFWRH